MQIIQSLAGGFGALAGASYLPPWLWRQYKVERFRKQLKGRRTLALTYDDGPSPFTPKLLDLLQHWDAKATFFMVGTQAGLYPGVADRVLREGHAIGNHSYAHVNAWKATPWRATRDIEAGYESLSPWMVPNGMFRPPYGKMTLLPWLAVRRRAAPVWWWTIDSGDTFENVPTVSEIADRVRRDAGGVILLHDQARDKQRNTFVLELTHALLYVARQESLNIATLDQLVL